jgi:hypothetical protein
MEGSASLDFVPYPPDVHTDRSHRSSAMPTVSGEVRLNVATAVHH